LPLGYPIEKKKFNLPLGYLIELKFELKDSICHLATQLRRKNSTCHQSKIQKLTREIFQ